MSKAAALFPGQGSQRVGMGLWLDAHPAGSEIFDRAEAYGFPAREVCFGSDEETLRRTETAQPALYTTGAAAFAVLRSAGARFQAAAGHSLGEYAALYASEILSFEDGLGLVTARGRLMAEAGLGLALGMSAVLGLDFSAVEALCAEASSGGDLVCPANFNCPGQAVVSGSKAALERVSALAREAGARRVIPLAVSGAFHSPYMEPAQKSLEKEALRRAFHAPRLSFYPNASARSESSPVAARSLAVSQLTRPVLWEQTLRQMAADGVTTFVEAGSGAVLTGLVKRTLPEAAAYSTDTEEQFRKALDGLAGR